MGWNSCTPECLCLKETYFYVGGSSSPPAQGLRRISVWGQRQHRCGRGRLCVDCQGVAAVSLWIEGGGDTLAPSETDRRGGDWPC